MANDVATLRRSASSRKGSGARARDVTSGSSILGCVFLCGSLLLNARPGYAQQGWSSVVDELTSGEAAGAPEFVVDRFGNAMVAWSAFNGATSQVKARRYTAATGVWRAAVTLADAGPTNSSVTLGVDVDGNVILLWTAVTGGVRVLQAARFTPATGAWSPPAPVATDVIDPILAVDRHGNLVAVWYSRQAATCTTVIRSARFDAARGTLSGPADISSPFVAGMLSAACDRPEPTVAIDHDGNAIALWRRTTLPEHVMQAAHYSAADAAWRAEVDLGAVGQIAGLLTAYGPELAFDASGNAMAVWTSRDGSEYLIQSARYSAATGNWSTAHGLSDAASSTQAPQIAVDSGGNFIAVWSRSDGATIRTESRRWTAAGSTWSAATFLSLSSGFDPQVAIDSAGNATAVWTGSNGSTNIIEAARYDAIANTWSTAREISNRTPSFQPRLGVDAAGNVIAVWPRFEPPPSITIDAVRWDATPSAPTVTLVTPAYQTLLVAFASAADEPAYANTNYEYSVDNGATWTTRSPASAASPLAIGSLANGDTYSIRLRGVNRAGAGAASEAATGVPGPLVQAPTNLSVVSIVGQTATLEWIAPGGSVAPTGYVLEGGLTPGSVLASIPTGSTATTFTFSAPTGAFYVRVHAIAGIDKSLASNEARIFVNVPPPPSAPANLLGLANGSSLHLAWRNTSTAGIATSIVVEVTGAVSASLSTPVTEVLTFHGVAAGTYTFAVRAVNGSGASAPSNSVTLTFPGACVPPDTPTEFVANRVGNAVTVSWALPATGAAPTGYVLIVTGSFAGTIPTTGTSLSGVVGPGSYTISVAAANPCGTSAPTSSQTVAIP